MSRNQNSEIVRLTKKLMQKENVEGVVEIQSILKEMLKRGVETLFEGKLE